jgi:hypothetical protein
MQLTVQPAFLDGIPGATSKLNFLPDFKPYASTMSTMGDSLSSRHFVYYSLQYPDIREIAIANSLYTDFVPAFINFDSDDFLGTLISEAAVNPGDSLRIQVKFTGKDIRDYHSTMSIFGSIGSVDTTIRYKVAFAVDGNRSVVQASSSSSSPMEVRYDPATRRLRILRGPLHRTLRLLDILGRTVAQAQISETGISETISPIQAGVYFLVFENAFAHNSQALRPILMRIP